MESLKNISGTADAYFKVALQNPYVMAILKITIVLYAAQLAPRLPSSVSYAMQNTYVKILALFFILYVSERDFQLAILLAIAFVVGANVLSGRGPLESFATFDSSLKGDVSNSKTHVCYRSSSISR